MSSRGGLEDEPDPAAEAATSDVVNSLVPLAEVLDAMPHAVLVVDHEGRVLFANLRTERLLGYRRAEIAGKTIEMLVPSDRAAHAPRQPDHSGSAPQVRPLATGRELRAVRKDGLEVPVEVTLNPCRLGDRRVVLCTLQDATRRKEAEQARFASEDQLRLFEAAIRDTDDAVLITTPSNDEDGGRILFVNSAFTRLTGYEQEDLLGQWTKILRGPGTDRAEMIRLRKIAGEGRPYRGQTMHYRKDGSSFWGQWSVSPIRDAEGQVHYVVVGRDVTAELDRARALEESQRFLQATIDAFSANVAVLKPDGEVLAVNGVWREAAVRRGFPERASVGWNYFEAFESSAKTQIVPIAQLNAAIREVIDGERPSFHAEYPRDEAGEHWMGVQVSPFAESPPRPVVVAFTDVTERKRIENLLDKRLAWKRLIAEVSTRFIDLPVGSSDAAIIEALGAIGEFLRADRVYVFQPGEDGHVLRHMHAYQAPHVSSDPGLSPGAWAGTDSSQRSADEGWRRRVGVIMRHLRHSNVYQVSAVSELPEESEERALLERGGIQSILCVPMVHRQRVLGFVGVDAIGGARGWSEEDRLSLQTVAEILANACSRWRTERLFRSVVHGISGVTGGAFLSSLVEELCRGLEVDYAFVGELWGDDAARTLAMHGPDGPGDNFTFDLEGTPCAYVVSGKKPCIHRRDVAAQFPDSPLLQQLAIEAYAGMPLLDAEGKVTGLLVVMYKRPIMDAEVVSDMLRVFAARAGAEVERRRQEEELRALNQALEWRVEERTREVMLQATAMDATSEGMTILVNDVFVYMNDAHARMYGYESGRELLGKSWTMLHTPEEVARMNAQVLPELLESHRYRGELRGLRRDGSTFDLEISLTLTDQGYLIGCCEDITERKRMQDTLSGHRDALRQANTDLARAARLKDEFLASMSHELRTPLNAVLGMAEVLQEEMVGSLNDRQMSCVRIIDESGRHLLSLINDILDLSKIEAGKLELAIGNVDVRVVCEASLRLIRPAAQAKQQRVFFVCDAGLTRVRADERRLKQMLMNLLGNAVKFTPEGGEIGLEARADFFSGQAQFIVWDSGIGIAAEDQGALFQPFSQLDQGLTKQHAGTGLGLSLVRRLAELHGGSVSVESERGRGSRFTIVLPWETTMLPGGRHTPIPPVAGASLADVTGVTSSEDGPTVLVVDDNEPSLRMLSDYLVLRNYRVIAARNGVEAVDIVAAEPVEAVLMDIQMPGMDGLAAIRAIRQELKRAALPIIAMTALAMSGDRERCLSAGANEYVTKPVSPRHLLTLLNALLSAWPMR